MPRKPQVSVRGETYARLKKEAERRGISATEMLEKILAPELKQMKTKPRK